MSVKYLREYQFQRSISRLDLDSWGRSGILVGSGHMQDLRHPDGTDTVRRHHKLPARSLCSHMDTLRRHMHTNTHFNVNVSFAPSKLLSSRVPRGATASVALRSQSDRFGSRTKKTTHQRD